MSELIDMQQVVEELGKRPRGRACFVFTQDRPGRHQWAERLAEITGMQHLNLMKLFADDKNLGGDVSSFDIATCFKLLAGYNQTSVLIVSGIEFLKATWTAQINSVEQLATMVEMWDRKPAILMVMQYDKALAEKKYSRHPQLRMVINQAETKAIT
ncbi:MAG: hypothetical protein WCI51_05735 [Lentisphaerota bacterium]